VQNSKGNAPFGGEHLHSLIVVSNTADLIGCATGANSLGEIDFAAPSLLSITP
jgi:hypothetical protein